MGPHLLWLGLRVAKWLPGCIARESLPEIHLVVLHDACIMISTDQTENTLNDQGLALAVTRFEKASRGGNRLAHATNEEQPSTGGAPEHLRHACQDNRLLGLT